MPIRSYSFASGLGTNVPAQVISAVRHILGPGSLFVWDVRQGVSYADFGFTTRLG